MAKEKIPDLTGPDDEALEQHVREMLDITEPDPPSAPVVEPKPKTTKSATKPITISVTHHDEQPEEKPAEVSELDAVIAATNDQLAEQTGTAPLVAKKPKKVVITHFDDELPEETPAEPAAEGTADVEQPPADEPLLETEAVEPEEASTEPVDPVEQAEPESLPDNPEESPLEEALESPDTEKAVSEIIAEESDELLAAHDGKQAAAVPKKPRKRSWLYRWAHSSAARWITFLIIFAVAVGVAATPTSRYFLLNKAGVRSTASVTVLDQSTQQPLKNASITLAGKTAQTDAEGKASFSELYLGPAELVINRRAFAEVRQAVTVGWGSNPLGEFSMAPRGTQYTFTVTDTFSGKPVGNAEASLEDSSATANDQGEITLTIDERKEQQLKITVKAPGYRDEIIDMSSSNKQKVAVALTPSHKVSFVSKRNGTYDIYTIDADGKNETLILAGTGKETQDLILAPHPVADVAVLVSTRDGKRSNGGSSLQSLLLINLADKSTKPVIESPQIKLVDWIGSRIVYVYMVADAEDQDPGRYKLMSYDYISGDNRQLAVANYFNDVVSAKGAVYYSPASAYQNGVNVGVFAVQPDGSGKQPILTEEAWNILRTAYDKLSLAVQQDWYGYTLGDKQAAKLSGQPSNTTSRVYTDSPDRAHSIWIDSRDGKGTLIVYDTAAKTETVLYAQNGVRGPVRWLNNTSFVFRVATGSETADYAMSIDGGTPKKISDVTNTSGIDRWSY